MAAAPSSEIEGALADLRAGRALVLEGEAEAGAVLACAAEHADAAAVNFMARDARGVVCLALPAERCAELDLELIPRRAVDGREAPAFTVSIEAAAGVTTGISAADRARTIAVAIDPAASRADLHTPGHVFPLRARPGGVLERLGAVEAAVDLTRAAELRPGAALCAILGDDGHPIAGPELRRFCERHGLRRVDAVAVATMRCEREAHVKRLSAARLAIEVGDFESVVYRSLIDGVDHRALVKGRVAGREEVLVRVHTACAAGEAFGAADCDCGELLRAALAAIAAEGEGVLLYLTPRPGREHEPDLDLGAQILADLGLSSLRLMSADRGSVAGLERHGLTLVDLIAVEPALDPRDEVSIRV